MGPFSEMDTKFQYIVVFIDNFCKYAVAVVLADMTEVSVARVFLDRWVSYFGMPKELHKGTDKGTNYESAIMLDLCDILGPKKTKTTTLRPEGDGISEHLNQTLLELCWDTVPI